ncbi:MAG: hypothetical protein C6H99_04500 [Epsilonproteobacteria bacterium]|nr:hypothetical protein [Campylobacterota bacterium]NPA63627.1 hypothetical protein [Campylobacterota bacterium]
MKKGLIAVCAASMLCTLYGGAGIERSGMGIANILEIEEHMGSAVIQQIEDEDIQPEFKEDKEAIVDDVVYHPPKPPKPAPTPEPSDEELAIAQAQEVSEHIDDPQIVYEEIGAEEQIEALPPLHKGHSLLELVEQESLELPDEVHELLLEVKRAVRFYKKPELFEDITLTDPLDLADPAMMEQIRQKIEQAQRLRSQEIAQKILKHQTKVQLKIAGEFVRYGDGQYDWVFVTFDGKVFKLKGVDPRSGNFDYEYLPEVVGSIAPDGSVSFEASSGDELALLLASQSRQGYPYAKYDDPEEKGFDWIVITQDGNVYKLEGYDEEAQSFVYTPVEDILAIPQGDEVELLPGS